MPNRKVTQEQMGTIDLKFVDLVIKWATIGYVLNLN